MTQPPDDRPRPEQPGGDGGPENEPTVAWTPPDAEPGKPAAEGGPGYAAVPDQGTGIPPTPETPAEPPTPEAPPPPAGDVPPAAAAGPIISATPTPPASGWEQPGQAAVPPPVPPTGGWEVPAAAAAAPQQDGYVIAGVGARFVAWLIDITLSSIIPVALTLAFFDWSGLIEDALEQARTAQTGAFSSMTYTIPITLNFILATLIGIGIQYLYFVGFWTSRWRAAPGQMGLRMRVVDATSGGTLSVVQASKRWFALGLWLPLLGLVPQLQSASGLIQFALQVFLFFTTVTNDRRQGLHDRWANSLVIRSVTSGNGATFAGCLVWGVMIILLVVILWTIVFAAAWPQFQEYFESLPSNPV